MTDDKKKEARSKQMKPFYDELESAYAASRTAYEKTVTHYTDDWAKPKCGADFSLRLSQRNDWVDCPRCLELMNNPVVHFTKAPAGGVSEEQAAAMCLCDHWDPSRDTYSRTPGPVTCPECLKLMGLKAIVDRNPNDERFSVSSNQCRHNCVTLDRFDSDKALCHECGKKVFRLRADMVWKTSNPSEQPPPGFVWNPEYFTASHEMDMTGCVHPDVFTKLPWIAYRQCRLPSGTYTAK